MNKSELKQLIREEIRNLTTQPVYSVWVQTNGRYDRNFLVRANSKEEAQEIAKNDDDFSWDDEITDIGSHLITDEEVDERFWEEDDWYNNFINDPSQQSYLYDAGT
jgi:hypothetical protein|tara:strand:- start:1040 stop:1357 length:318 start_codon:yes stop_codon:yes gene_type:complete